MCLLSKRAEVPRQKSKSKVKSRSQGCARPQERGLGFALALAASRLASGPLAISTGFCFWPHVSPAAKKKPHPESDRLGSKLDFFCERGTHTSGSNQRSCWKQEVKIKTRGGFLIGGLEAPAHGLKHPKGQPKRFSGLAQQCPKSSQRTSGACIGKIALQKYRQTCTLKQAGLASSARNRSSSSSSSEEELPSLESSSLSRGALSPQGHRAP